LPQNLVKLYEFETFFFFFTANSGGLLGLFTGFSVVTLVELLYFATLRLCCNLRRRRVKESDFGVDGPVEVVVISDNAMDGTQMSHQDSPCSKHSVDIKN
jgi:hypothetical protein